MSNPRADFELRKLEEICSKLGINETEYGKITKIIHKLLKYISQDFAEEMLTWSADDLLKQQKETRLEKEQKKGIWRED